MIITNCRIIISLHLLYLSISRFLSFTQTHAGCQNLSEKACSVADSCTTMTPPQICLQKQLPSSPDKYLLLLCPHCNVLTALIRAPSGSLILMGLLRAIKKPRAHWEDSSWFSPVWIGGLRDLRRAWAEILKERLDLVLFMFFFFFFCLDWFHLRAERPWDVGGYCDIGWINHT